MAHRTRIQGADELDRLLRQLPPVVRKQPFANATRKGARLIRDSAKRKVKVGVKQPGREDEPHLIDTITTMTVRARDRAADWTVRVGSTLFRARFQELGTVKQVARPFLRPAADENQAAVKQILVDEIGKGVTKAAKRLAGRLTRKQRRRIFR